MNYVLDDIIKGIVYDKDPFISDADDVGIEFMDFFRESINEYFNVQFKKGDIVLYEIHKTLPLKHKGITRQNFLPAVRYLGNKPEFTKLLLRDGFKETISLLLNGNLNYDEKKQFLINTSRNNELYDDIERKTQETFKNNDFMVNNNIIYDPDKPKIAYDKGARLFFEDNPYSALSIIQRGTPIVMPKHDWNCKTPRDIILLDTVDAKAKHELIDELNSYDGKMLFRFDNLKDFADYIKSVIPQQKKYHLNFIGLN